MYEADKFVAKLELSIEGHRNYELSVRKKDDVEYKLIGSFRITDGRTEKQLYSKDEQYWIDNKEWTSDHYMPSQEIMQRSIEILKDMAYV